MNKFAQLAADITKLWTKYGTAYLSGIENTLILALVGTVIGCLIGFVCGVLNTIPRRPNDHPLKKIILTLVRVIIRIYVEVFRGTPMVLQAVFLFYGLPYFTDNAVKFSSVWAAAIVVVSINTGAYMAESVRGGIISVDPGQTEGAMAIGMTHVQTMTSVILAGAAQYHAADRKQLHYQREGHLCYVYHRIPRFLCGAPGDRRRELSLLPLCHGGDGGLSHHDADCVFPAAVGGEKDGRLRQL